MRAVLWYNCHMKLRAYAKLNLSLNVVGKRGNMHLIDSVMTSVDVFDEVVLSPRADKVVTVDGVDCVASYDNTAYKAAVRFSELFDVGGADIAISKGIPFGAGMGGSSADAAAVLVGLANLYDVPKDSDKLRQIAVSVGSDVWYMMCGGYARVGGCGEIVEPFSAAKPMWYMLTTFDTPCDTAVIYRIFDDVGGDSSDNDKLVRCLQNGRQTEACAGMSNGLQSSVTRLTEYAEPFLFFAQSRELSPVMTGSGSAYFVPACNKQQAREMCEIFCCAGFRSTVVADVPHGVEIV